MRRVALKISPASFISFSPHLSVPVCFFCVNGPQNQKSKANSGPSDSSVSQITALSDFVNNYSVYSEAIASHSASTDETGFELNLPRSCELWFLRCVLISSLALQIRERRRLDYRVDANGRSEISLKMQSASFLLRIFRRDSTRRHVWHLRIFSPRKCWKGD